MTLGFSVEELVPASRGGARLRMGLMPVAPDAWLQPAVDQAVRRDALAQPRAVIVRPEAAPAVAELGTMLSVTGNLGEIAATTWEDLCLLLPDAQGRPVLAAGAVGFPTDWVLADKIGLPVTAIHAPIHGYVEQLAAGVDHFLQTLPAGPIYGRANWFVVASDALRYLPTDDPATRFAHVTADNAGQTLFVRCERQTLRRLPGTGAILFTIGVAVAPLDRLSAGVVRRVAAAVAQVPDGEHERRAAPFYATALAGYAAGLESRLETAA